MQGVRAVTDGIPSWIRIGGAFVTGQAAIEKRITRAKKVLAGSKRLFDLTAPADFPARLPAVHRALYLVFSEGYHGASRKSAMHPSPIVALNRAIAVAQKDGPERALKGILSIIDRDRPAAYPFYFAALGKLEFRRGRHDTAREHFRGALSLARNPMECRFLEQRVGACD